MNDPIARWIYTAVCFLILEIPAWRLVKRTGRPGALSLLFWVPLVNVGFFWWLAFSPWPPRSEG